MSQLRPALVLFIVLAIITGGLYPFLMTSIGQTLFNEQANGSLVVNHNQVQGSELIGQQFIRPDYFHGRPSATLPEPYNAANSAASNLAGSNPELDQKVKNRIEKLRAANPDAPLAVPIELVTQSASGLDANITPESAHWQIARIAKARNLPEETISMIISANTHTPIVNFIGQPVVNVLQLNIALDALSKSGR